jgi:D-alanyl-D-alanine endopeptidase (penicillin-binding protein 7)
MNARAEALGMRDSRFVDPTGLSSRNVSNAHDLTRLMRGGFEFPLVRQFSTASGLTVEAGRRPLAYHNTNRLIANPAWEIGLQKTGYISEAGSCLVMQAMVSGRGVLMVLLDAVGRRSRFGDAQRLKQWMEAEHRRRGSQQIGRLAVRSAG